MVSIVLCIKNEERNLPDVIASIRAQSRKDHELIVVDNGSTDRSDEVLALLDVSPLQSHGTLSDARRVGVEAANGAYLFFVDADHVLTSNCLAACIHAVESREVSAVVVPERAFKPSNAFQRLASEERALVERSGRGIPRFYVMKRYREIGGHKPNILFGEDAILLFALRPAEIAIAEDTVILHKELESPLVAFKKYIRYGRSYRGDKVVGPVTTYRASKFACELARLAGARPLTAFAIGAIKLMKLAALQLGRLQQRIESFRAT